MPISIFDVASVTERPVGRAHQWRTKYDICPAVSAGTPATLFETFNPFIASLCERAQATQKPVRVVWKDSRYGREIVSAVLVDSSAAEVA